jgi:hypothetical protein
MKCVIFSLLIAVSYSGVVVHAEEELPALGWLFRANVHTGRLPNEPSYSIRTIQGIVQQLESERLDASNSLSTTQREKIETLLKALKLSLENLDTFYAKLPARTQ